MKKIIKILSLVLCLELFLLSACTLHDSREKDMKKYMDSIDCEFEGYALKGEKEWKGENDDCELIDWYIGYRGYTFIVQEKTVSLAINHQMDEKFGNCYSIVITIDNEEILIDHEYLKSNSETYNRIIKMWESDGWEEIIPEVVSVVVYDNNLFIAISRINREFVYSWKCRIPAIVFHFDMCDYSIKYAGYYGRLEEKVYLYKK